MGTPSPWRHFTREELTCRCGCGRMEVNPATMAKAVSLREQLGFPLPVSSGFRCPSHNNAVSSTGLTGPHTTGQSLDFRVPGRKAFEVVSAANAAGFTGIGVSQKGPHGERFIHLDDLPDAPGQPRPWIWSY